MHSQIMYIIPPCMPTQGNKRSKHSNNSSSDRTKTRHTSSWSVCTVILSHAEPASIHVQVGFNRTVILSHAEPASIHVQVGFNRTVILSHAEPASIHVQVGFNS